MVDVSPTRDIFSGIVAYDPSNFDDYVFAFKNKLTLQNHHYILNGTESRPPATDDGRTEQEVFSSQKITQEICSSQYNYLSCY